MAKRSFSKRLRRMGDVLGQVMLMYLQRQRQQEQLESARQFELAKQEKAFQNNIRLAEFSARLADERQQRLFTHRQELAKAKAIEKARTIQERKKDKEDADKFQAFVNKNKLYSARIASLTQAIKSLETIPGEEAAAQRNRYVKEMNVLFKGQGELYEEFGMVAPVSQPEDGILEEIRKRMEAEKFINSEISNIPVDKMVGQQREGGVFTTQLDRVEDKGLNRLRAILEQAIPQPLKQKEIDHISKWLRERTANAKP